MATPWTSPTTVVQYSEPEAESVHIAWDSRKDFAGIKSLDGQSVQTVGDLLHLARSPKIDWTNKTYYLLATAFDFGPLPETISGVSACLNMRRGGRVMDETIQLAYAGVAIGENRASLTMEPSKVYGGIWDTWAADLTSDMVSSASFGIIIRLQSHISTPHRTPGFIDSVQLRIW